jgi:hypothetical protein
MDNSYNYSPDDQWRRTGVIIDEKDNKISKQIFILTKQFKQGG